MTVLLPVPALPTRTPVDAGPGQLALTDRYGRTARDLRVSLTDRCNLRCTYCMPAEGLDWQPADELLTDAEIVRLIAIGVQRLGITSVRLTGGEPLLRKNLESLVAGIAELRPRPTIALTTNGIGLATRAAALLSWAMAEGVQLRFIEQMPLDAQHGWQRSEMVTAAEIRHRLSGRFQLVEDEQDALVRGSAPAELFRVVGTDYAVGIIASVSKPFCGACDRVRLTADGQIRNCLFARTESDLRTPLRGGADDAEIARQWVVAVRGKQAGHGIDDPSFLQPERPMS